MNYLHQLLRKDVYLRTVDMDKATTISPFPAEIPLQRDKVTVGRSNQVDCCILSQNISKLHAELHRTGSALQPSNIDGVHPTHSWYITDCSSTNGVYVNGKRLAPGLAQVLLVQDEVCFQCNFHEPSSVYIFLVVDSLPATPLLPPLPPPPPSSSTSPSRTPSSQLHKQQHQEQQQQVDGESSAKKPKLAKDNGGSSPNWLSGGLELRILKLEMEQLEEKLAEVQRENVENLRDQADAAATKEAEIALQLRDVKTQLNKSETARVQLEDDLSRLEKASANLKQEKSNLEKEISKLGKSHTKLKQEKTLLADEIARLEQTNIELSAEVLAKTNECEEQEERLKEAKEAISTATAAAAPSSQGTSAVNLIRNVLEAECQCSICSEFFYKTTTLQCSHSYCGHCIAQWQKKKKDCPICRHPITTLVPTLVVDGLIDRVVEMVMPEDVQERRKEVVEERNELDRRVKTTAAAAAVDANVAGPSTQRRAPRGRTRRQTAAAAAIPPVRPPMPPVRPPMPPVVVPTPRVRPPTPAVDLSVIELSSSQSSTDPDESNDDLTDEYDDEIDDDDGDIGTPGTGAYYGGYGHCYVCGDAGHWANGCPFR